MDKNISKFKETEQSWSNYVKSYPDSLIISNGSALSKDIKTVESYVKILSGDIFDCPYLNISDNNKTNHQIIHELVDIIKTDFFKEKIIILQLNSDDIFEDIHSTLNQVDMFIEWNKKFHNIVIPFFSDLSNFKTKYEHILLEKIKFFNIENDYDILKKLYEEDSSFVSKKRLTQNGHQALAKYILRYILTHHMNKVLEKRDDLRIEIYELEQTLYKIWDKDRQKEYDDKLESETSSARNEIETLKKHIDFLENELELRMQEIRVQSNVEKKLSNQLKLKEVIIKNHHSQNQPYIKEIEKITKDFNKQKKLLLDRDDELNLYKTEREEMMAEIIVLNKNIDSLNKELSDMKKPRLL